MKTTLIRLHLHPGACFTPMPPLPVSARPRSPPRVGRLWVVLLLWLAAFAGVAGAAADAGPRRFDIPAGAAVSTIKRAAQQAGLEIVYSATMVEGVRTPAVVGEFRPREGIERLLAGTGLRLVEDKQTGALSISRQPVEQPKAHPPDSTPSRNGNSETTRKDPAPMKSRSLFALLTGWLAAGSAVDAQAAVTPPKDDTVVLSPFVVTTDHDKGYVATSTLAGTRLNTELRDIGAAIQVVTRNLMDDLAATSYNNVLLFTTNTETAGLGGNFSGADFPNRGRVSSDNVLNDPSGANRVRGLAAPDRTRDYFLTSIPFDSYNSDRVDISRGANSILFGLGSPAGVVNQTMLRADLQRSTTELRLQSELGAANNLSTRVSLDHNALLIKGRSALRFAALRDNQNFQQEPAFREQRRLFGTLTVRPWSATTLRASFESGNILANNPDALAPAEDISGYLYQLKRYQAAAAAARLPVTNLPLYHDPFNTAIRNTAAFRAPNVVVPGFGNPMSQDGSGLYKNIALVYDNAASTTPSFAFQTAVNPVDVLVLANYLGRYPVPPEFRPTTFDRALHLGVRNLGPELPGWSIQGLTDFAIYDFSRNLLAGTAGRQTQNFNTGNIVLEHALRSGRAGLELAYNRQRFLSSNSNPFRGPGGAIRIDLNRTLTVGGDNPNFGRPYVIDRLNLNNGRTDGSAFRATAFGKLDFGRDLLPRSRLGRWLGVHTLTGLYSSQTDESRWTLMQEAWNSGGDPRVDAILDSSIGVNQFQRQVAYLDYIGPAVNLLADPAALRFTDFAIARRAIVNQAIPAVGGVVPAAIWNNFSPVLQTYPLTRAPYTRFGGLTRVKVASEAAVLQSRLFEDTLVTTIGWRQDRQDYSNNNRPPVDPADPSKQNLTTAPQYFTLEGIPITTSRGRTLTTSVVGRLPLAWRQKLPRGTEVSLFLSKSDNLQPDPGRLDQYQRILSAPAGETREIGVNLSALQGRLQLRINRYDSAVTGVSNRRLGNLFQVALVQTSLRELQFIYDDSRGADPADPQYQRVVRAGNEIAGLFGARIDPAAKTITVDDRHPYAKTWRAANPSLIFHPVTGELQSFFYTSPPNLSDTQDIESSGYEAELVVNPTRGWRLLLNVAKQETQTANSLPNLAALIRDFEPVIYGAPGAPSFVGSLNRGNPFLNFAGGETNADFWLKNVKVPFFGIKAFDGTSSPEQRKWRANFVTNYEFSGERLKGVSIGANVRWQDRVAIGYPLVTDNFNNLVPDRAHLYYGPTELAVGFRAGYRRAILGGRVRWTVALNLQNAFSRTTDLIPVLAQPDGSIAQVRTAPPRSVVLTNTLNF